MANEPNVPSPIAISPMDIGISPIDRDCSTETAHAITAKARKAVATRAGVTPRGRPRVTGLQCQGPTLDTRGRTLCAWWA
jgi:hypothetical protein